MVKKNSFIRLLILLVFSSFLALSFSLPDSRPYFIACNVGQGDAFLIVKGRTQILIDAGPNDKVLTCLAENMPFYDRTIELIINTHPDKDHLYGFIQVLERYQVKQIINSSFWQDTDVFKQFHQQVSRQKIPVYAPLKGDKIKLANMELEFLWPLDRPADLAFWYQSNYQPPVLSAQTQAQKTNENSLVFLFQIDDFDILFTGDISAKQEKEILKTAEFKDIEILKVAHHASKYSSSEEFLKAVKPQIAVISVGKNSWGHPTKEVLERLKEVNARVLRTDQDNIRLKLD